MDYRNVEELVSRAYMAGGIVGVSVTVSENGRHSHFQAGYADADAKTPVDKGTVFPIASCTKSFLGTAAAILAHRGVLDLDEPVKTHYPELSMTDKYAEKHISLRDLLCHRSGVPRHDIAWAANLGESLSAGDIVEKWRYLPPFTSFRERMEYTNIGYVLSGQVVGRAAGKSWDSVIREELIGKIGVSDISFNIMGLMEQGNRAIRYKLDMSTGAIERQAYDCLDPMGPASCINTSTSELIKWADAQMGINGEGCEGLSLEAIREAHTPQMPLRSKPAHPASDMRSYGLGWSIMRYKGRKVIYHTGEIDGFSAVVFFMPDEKCGGAMTVSHAKPVAFSVPFLYALIDAYLDGCSDWDEMCMLTLPAPEPQKPEETRVCAPPLPLGRYEGTYLHGGYGKLEVAAGDGKLSGKLGNLAFSFKHKTQNHFSILVNGYDINIAIEFIVSPNGEVNAADIRLEPLIPAPERFARRG